MISKYKELGECIELIIDHRGKTPKKMGGGWISEGVKTISAKNVHGGKLDNIDSIRCVSQEVYKKWMKEDIKRGDCLLASEGATLGENLYWNSDDKVVIGQRLYCIRTDNSILDSKYFSAYMNTHEYQKEIEGRATGTSVLGINQTDLLKTLVLIKDIKEQRFIGNLYFEINDKIETNNEINKKLEKMAQAIFKQWFVDFEFPNEDGEPYKSSGGEMVESEMGMIPKGWGIEQLNELCDVKKGLSYKGKHLVEQGIPMINLGNINPGGGFRKDKLKFYNGEFKENQTVNVGDIVIANTDMTQDRVILGSPTFIPNLKSERIIYTHHLFAFRNVKIPKSFLYHYLKSSSFRERAETYATGTTVLAISKDSVLNIELVVPDKNMLMKYDNIVCAILKKIDINNEEIQNLQLLRDTLLPKLMSGEIRVPINN